MEHMLDLVLNGIYVEQHGVPGAWPGLIPRWQQDIRTYVRQGLLTDQEAKRAERELGVSSQCEQPDLPLARPPAESGVHL